MFYINWDWANLVLFESNLIYPVCFQFPNLAIGNSELLHLIVSCIDGSQVSVGIYTGALELVKPLVVKTKVV